MVRHGSEGHTAFSFFLIHFMALKHSDAKEIFDDMQTPKKKARHCSGELRTLVLDTQYV